MGPVTNRYDLRDRAGPETTLPKMVHEFDIVEGRAPGASLTIKFENIFLHPPVQGDVTQGSAPSPSPSSVPSPDPASDSASDSASDTASDTVSGPGSDPA